MSNLTEKQLQDELAMRENIMSVLQIKRAGAGTDAERGKIERAIDAVNAGDTTNTLVKSIIKDITKQKKAMSKEQRVSNSEISLDELITTHNFQIANSGAAVWYYQTPDEDEFGNRNWYSIKKETLLCAFPVTDVHIPMGEGVEAYNALKEFNIKLVDQKRTFNRIIQSYKDSPGALNLMNQNFCMPAEDGSADYHWIFDALIESISGGEKDSEEFNAMQQTIYAKYLHPENSFIPNPTVRDIEGRSGKGLFSNRFLRRLFNGNIADNCNADHVVGKFNGVIAGKAVVVINETNREKIDSERTKAFLGSPKILVENKYEKAYEADNTCLVFFFTNNINGGVNVSGTRSDARFSFFTTTKDYYTVVRKYFKEVENLEMGERDVKRWTESMKEGSGQNLLFDEQQMGKWINAMVIKFGDVTDVEPMHGKEHKEIIDRQRGAWTRTVEQVFTESDFEYIRSALLVDLVREFNKGEMLPGRNKMLDEIQRLIKDRGWQIEFVQRAHIKVDKLKTIQRPVFRKAAFENGRLTSGQVLNEEESNYGTYDSNGRWVWNWRG